MRTNTTPLPAENEDKTGKGIAAALDHDHHKKKKKHHKHHGGRHHLSREDIWVTSKLWNAHHRPEEATKAIEKSISDLGVDYLDLYLMHWPVAFLPDQDGDKLDETVSIVDTWRAMENLVRANLTRFIGVSNFARHEVDQILSVCVICPYAHEFETHPYLQQQEFVDYHFERGIKVIAYSPLGNTNPTYDDTTRDKDVGKLLEDPFWKGLAGKKGVTVAQAVLAWGAQRGTVVIPKSVREEHIDENRKGVVGGKKAVEFTKEEMEEISKRDKKVRMNNPGESWGVPLFSDLDDPTKLDGGDDEGEEVVGDL